MRYHIASLIAVFLALTIGLLLGSSIVDKDSLVRQQQRLVNSIRTDISRLSTENKTLQAELAQTQNFQNQIFPIAVKNRLADKGVVVVTLHTGQDELLSAVDNAVKSAGAETSQLHIDVKGLDFSDEDLVERLTPYLDTSGTVEADFQRRFWAQLAGELAGQESPDVLGELVALELIEVDMASVPMENIVVLAVDKKLGGNREVLFFEAISQLDNVRVIGVETSETRPSRVASYKLRNVSTVDNIDNIMGKISLVYLLEEREVTAHFGVKPTAERLMP